MTFSIYQRIDQTRRTRMNSKIVRTKRRLKVRIAYILQKFASFSHRTTVKKECCS